MVKALKGDEIRGYFECKIGNQNRRFTRDNVHEFVERIPRVMARHILRHHESAATIVPIPNSHVTSPSSQDFRTLDLARKIAEYCNGQISVEPAIVFSQVQDKARNGGSRHPDYLEDAYDIVRPVSGPIILVDDVCTSGGHIIAAYRRLNQLKSPVVLACTFGRTTHVQRENPVGLKVEELDID